jgi:hypothetical protein
MMNESPGALLPELLLLAGAVIGLLAGLFLPRRRQGIVAVLAAAALVGAIIAAAIDLGGAPQRVFDDSYAVDVPLGDRLAHQRCPSLGLKIVNSDRSSGVASARDRIIRLWRTSP